MRRAEIIPPGDVPLSTALLAVLSSQPARLRFSPFGLSVTARAHLYTKL